MSNKSVRWAFNFTKWNPSRADMILATSCIQREEKERLDKFVFKEDVKSSLMGRLMMRKFVHETTNQSYREITFSRDDKGKPFLSSGGSDCRKITFNVSHQGDYAVLAGTEGDVSLGVDVVKIESPRDKSVNEYFRLMTRTFSAKEWKNIRGGGDETRQLGAFYRHWCLKESYLKAVGVGITINLQDVYFKINTSVLEKDRVVNDTEGYFEGRKLDWQFQEMLLDDRHCVAVAASTNTNDILVFNELDYNEIVKNAVPLLEADPEYCNSFFKKPEKGIKQLTVLED